MTEQHVGNDAPSPTHPVVVAYVALTGVVLLLMMVVGLLMRLSQAQVIDLGAALFYQLMTVHGVGMVGIAAFGGAAIMWHFLRREVALSSAVAVANLVLFLIGVAMILWADLIGGFGAGWTFLYPLPAHSGGACERDAAALHLGGLLVVGVGFLLFFLDVGRALIGRYGGLGRSLGWPQLFAGAPEPPPPVVVASAMVVIVDVAGLVIGAAILAMSLVNLYIPSFTIDPMLAKNMIYFFGHIFINATIYMAVIAVYELLPLATGRPWKASRVFLAAWTASTFMVLIAYLHHLLMDFVMPNWAHAIGQISSYTSGFPILVVTGLGALANVHRSGLRWGIVPAMLLLSMFGWMAGVIPAIIDAVIKVNLVMHNTMWVPGHFHFYLLLGQVSMLFGFMYHLSRPGAAVRGSADGIGLFVWIAAGLGFVGMFLYSGRHSVPRRWAEHLPEWQGYDVAASVFAVLVVAAAVVFVSRFLAAVPRLARSR